jgi:glycosyltransferase 2 family protein
MNLESGKLSEYDLFARCQQMLERFIEWVNLFRSWYSRSHNRPIFCLFRWIATLGILTASAWFIWKQVSDGYATVATVGIALGYPQLVISWLCITASTALGAWEWILLVNALGGRLGTIRGMRIHLVSNLSKYVPGFVWPYVGKVYLAAEQGIPANIAALSVVGEFAIVFFDGILLMLLSLPFSGIVLWSTGQRLILQLAAILLAGAGICIALFAGRQVVNRLPSIHLEHHPVAQVNWGQITLVIIAVLLTWCLLGIGFYMLDVSATSRPMQNPLRLTVALPFALLGGQLALFVPMGIGVREAILVALLGPRRSAVLVVIIAIMFRIEMMVGEVTSTVVAVLWDTILDNRRTNTKG